MSETRLELQIVSESKSAIDALDSLAAALGRVRTAASKGFTHDLSKNIVSFGQALKNSVTDGTVKRYEQLANAMERLNKASSRLGSIPGLNSSDGASGIVNASVRNSGMTQVAGQLESELAQSSEAITRASDALTSGTTQVGENIESSLGQAADAFSGAERQTKSFSTALKELFATTDRGHRPFSRLLSQFMRIAKLRVMREIIKSIMEGFKFGFENMYQYAKLVGNSFAPAVDAANNALFKMKNSLGAALAPAFQMIIPYVIQLVQWFINLLNIVNQFLALLRGQSTWTRATDAPASTLDKVKKSAKGATESVKELKGLLADWDELNIIQQETGGGGGGSGSIAADESAKYGLLFEEVSTFNENVQRIVEKVKEFVQWIKDNMDTILNIAKLIGVAILGWKVSSWFGGIIGTLIGWATTGIIAGLTFKMTLDYDEKYLETGDPGYLVKNILTSAVGAIAADKLMETITGSKLAGKVAFSIVMAFSAAADIVSYIRNKDVSALSKEGLALAVLSALKVGGTTMWLARTFGKFGFFESGLIGLGATGLVLGAGIGVKAVMSEKADLSEISQENAEAILLGAGIFGAGVALLTKTIGHKGVMASIGTGVGATIGTGLLLGAAVDLKAVLSGQVDKEDINEVTVRGVVEAASGIASYVFSAAKTSGQGTANAIGTSATAAIGTGLLVAAGLGVKALLNDDVDASEITSKTIETVLEGSAALSMYLVSALNGTKYSGTGGAFQGAGAIFATGLLVSAGIGVKAVLDKAKAVDSSEITEDTVKDIVKNAAMTGAGIALMAKSLGLLGAAGALGAGAIGAVATGLVIYALVGATIAVDKKNIAFGTINVTEDEIRKVVWGKLFDAKARVALKLVKDTVEMDETEKQNVEAAAGELFKTMNVVQLGVDTTNSIPKMIEQFNTLRETLKSYSKTRITALETSITLSPVVSESGEDLSAQFLKDSISGWDLINTGMENLGKELSQTFIDSTTGKLKENWDKDAAQAILEKVAAINSAVLGAQMQGQAANNLQAGLLGLDPNGADGQWSKASFDKAVKMYDDYITEMRKGYIQAFQGDALAAEMEAAYLRALLPNVTDEALKKEYEDKIADLEAQAKVFRDTVAERVEDAMADNAGQGESLLAKWFASALNPDKISEILGNGRYTASIVSEFNKALKNDLNPDEALSEAVKQTMMSSPALAELIPYMDRFGIDAASLLSDSLREKLMGVIGGAFTGAAASSDTKEAAQNAAEEVVSAAEEAVKDSRRSMSEAIIDAGSVGWVTAGSEAGKAIINSLAQEFSDDAGGLVQMLADTFGWNIEDILGNIDFSQMDGEQMQQFLESWNNSDLGLMYELDIDEESFNASIPAPDTSALTAGLDDTEASVAKNCQNIRAWFESLDGLSFTFSGDAMGGSMSVNLPAMPELTMAANGGLFTAGEMFIAREAGPEMVGRIGSRTGVANNNQIVDGITTGVASGQAEQNALLRQQNEYLRQMLAKESTVRVQPSTAWGEFNRKSSEMYARATGRG